MCGIAGIWRRSGEDVDPAHIERMLATIIHRGPDGHGLFHLGALALGHRRLAILDTTERANQPMITPDGKGVLVYNGETYNYRSIRRELEAEGRTFHSTGDTEVVLAALHQWGPERSIPRLNGMFAFAYFDRRDATLWLARDRLGIKSLVTADTGDAILFGSEVKALLANPTMTARVDLEALTKWIVRPQLQPHRLLFESIKSVEAGCWWKITRGSIEKHRYFDVLTELDVDRLLAARQAALPPLIDEFENLLRSSVELHMASDVPLATMCSGGVDSSLIAAYARGLRCDIRGYVADIDFPDAEGNQAVRVGRHLGIPIRRVAVDRELFLRLWPEAVSHSDGPLSHRSDPALLAVTKACRADGIKVLLTGEGSDELFGGYGRHLAAWGRWRRAEWPWSLLPSGRRLRKRLDRSPAPFRRNAHGGLDRRLAAVLDPDDDFIHQRILKSLARVEPASDRVFIAYCLADLYGHLSTLLHRHDRMGMAASMEMRVPFLENHLINFAIHLPLSARLRRGSGKWVVKKAAARRLPGNITYAKKKGFPVPDGFVRGTERVLANGRLAETMHWSHQATEHVIALLESDRQLCFYLVGVELWLRIFFFGENVEKLGDRLVALAS